MIKTDLEFLLREKYGYSATEEFLFFSEFPDLLDKPLKYKQFLPNDLYKDIQKLKKDYPVDYLIGYKEFLGSKIDLSKKTLIPRAETEFWVDKVLSDNSLDEKSVFLDMFTGSGCIGISIISQKPNSFVIFSDSELNAIKQTKINLKINKINDDRFKVKKSDLFSKLKNYKFDAIFANPPYISKSDLDIGKEIKYEPKTALYSDDNGLEIIKKFLSNAYKYLNENGVIFMEFGEDQVEPINETLIQLGKYSSWKFHKDQFKKYRWVEIYS